MVTVVGADATRGGWVAVTLVDGKLRSMALHKSLAELVEASEDAEAIAADIPMGHEDRDARRNGGRRLADEEARALLGPRGGTIFSACPPDLFTLDDHAAAVDEARRRGSIAPSAQLWSLGPRILEAEGLASDPRLVEAHPELSFQELLRLSGGGPHLEHAKTTWHGLVQRLELLRDVGLRPRRSFGGVGRASPDDVLDATAAAWTADRVARGVARSVPMSAPIDAVLGRPVVILT